MAEATPFAVIINTAALRVMFKRESRRHYQRDDLSLKTAIYLELRFVQGEHAAIPLQLGHAHQTSIGQLHLLVLVFLQQTGFWTGVIFQTERGFDMAEKQYHRSDGQTAMG